MRKCVFNSLFEHRVLCSNIKLSNKTVFVQTYNSLFKQIVLCSNKELKTHFRMSFPGLRRFAYLGEMSGVGARFCLAAGFTSA